MRLARSLFLLLILIVSNIAFAKSTGGFECRALFGPINLESRLDQLRLGDYVATHTTSGRRYMIRGQMRFRPPQKAGEAPGSIVGEVFLQASLKGNRFEAGTVNVGYFASSRALNIKRTFMEEGFEKNGLTKLMVGAALARFPETESITGHLIRDNSSLFKAAYYNSRARTPEARLREAFEQTPFFKTVRVYGFTEIDTSASYFRPQAANEVDQLFVVIKRPDAGQ